MVTFSKLLDGVAYDSVADISGLKIKGVSNDSRKVKEGDLFVCMGGAEDDGHAHALEAQMLGAAAIVAERETESSLPTAIVTNSRRAYSKICQNFFENPHKKLKIVTIIGTNGKTTTSYMTEHLLKNVGYKTGVIGTLGYKILDEKHETDLTTPDSYAINRILARMVRAGVEIAIMEVSAHAIAQDRLYGITSDISIFTNISEDHLDYFCDFRHYYDTKLSFFKKENTKSAIVNSDDVMGRELYKSAEIPIITYGIDEPSDVFALDIESKEGGTSFIVNVFDEIYEMFLPMYGKYNVYNAIAAITLVKLLKVPMPVICENLQKLPPIPGRFNVFNYKNAKIIVDFAHTPDGLEKLLDAAREISEGKVVLVFGCGGERDKIKRPLMGKIAARLADRVILTEDNSRREAPSEIIADIAGGMMESGNFEIVPDRREAVEYAAGLLCDGDVLVVAGKGAEKYIERGDRRIKYSDVDEALLLSRGEK